MAKLDWLNDSGILADEMGLGKTIQVIAYISYLRAQLPFRRAPILIIAPLSTLANWEIEFRRFAPQIDVIKYYGTPDDRAFLRRRIQQGVKGSTMVDTKMIHSYGPNVYPVILTTFRIASNDRESLSLLAPQEEKFGLVVVDESHSLKNYSS